MGQEQRNSDQVYTIDGIQYPSVSKILNVICDPEPLMYYACNKLIEKCRKLLLIENETTIDGVRSCSEILLALQNSKNAHIEYRDDRAEQGAAIHHAFEDHINGKIDLALDPKITKIIDNLIAWTKQNDVKWLASEKTVFNQWLCYAGTLDAIALIRGRPTYIDFKTSKHISDKNKMQIAAYAYADCTYDEFDCLILQIDTETAEITEHYVKNTPKNRDIKNKYHAFLHLLSHFYTVKARKLNNHRAKARA
jgi:hypothetical protein